MTLIIEMMFILLDEFLENWIDPLFHFVGIESSDPGFDHPFVVWSVAFELEFLIWKFRKKISKLHNIRHIPSISEIFMKFFKILGIFFPEKSMTRENQNSNRCFDFFFGENVKSRFD